MSRTQTLADIIGIEPNRRISALQVAYMRAAGDKAMGTAVHSPRVTAGGLRCLRSGRSPASPRCSGGGTGPRMTPVGF